MPTIPIGCVLSEKEIHEMFGCQTQFGIRLNKKNNAIIIVSDATHKNSYIDKWEGDTLYYTGTDARMDEQGNQTLAGTGNNNGALYNVWGCNPDIRPTLLLFIKYAPNQCTYKGHIELCAPPYSAPRPGNPSQSVWKFPLKLILPDHGENGTNFEDAVTNACKVDSMELLKRIRAKERNPNYWVSKQKRNAISTLFERDPEVSAYAKLRSKGICDLCYNRAPFYTHDGRPYLESHHIIWLARGGHDTIDNVVALCPNCHKKIHILDDLEDTAKLKKAAQHYKENGV